MNSTSLDRAAGVLLGQACGDALGVPYEFGLARLTGQPRMIGGGLGPYAPGEWSDDTQMAACIARVAATGADLTSAAALDQIAQGFLDWQTGGASDIGNQTSRVLRAARSRAGSAGRRLTEAAAADLNAHPNSAGNGALMRTSVVGISTIHDREATAEAARAIASLTHPHPDALDSCVLWSEAVRRAVLHGEFMIMDGLDLLEPDRRDRWRNLIKDAESLNSKTFSPNGWTVTALQAAWSAIIQTPTLSDDPAANSFACKHFQHALEAAVKIGHDTDTIAAIAGGLLGARWGVSAIPARWRRIVHGWPGLRASDLLRMGCLIARGGQSDGQGWPAGAALEYPPSPQSAAAHPADPGVILGTVSDLGRVGDAVVSLCRLGAAQVPASGVAPEDHLEFWLIDTNDPQLNPNLDFVLADAAEAVADLRAEDKTVLVHCVAAEQRTPSVALAYSRHLGIPPAEAGEEIKAALASTRGSGRLWEQAQMVAATANP